MAAPSVHAPQKRASAALRRRTTLGGGLALEQARDALVAGLESLSGRLRRAAAPVKDAAHDAAEATQAVAQTAERAAHVPQDVAHEVRKEIQAWTEGLGRTVALGALLGVLGFFALVLLTWAAVEGLDGVLGEPWGAVLMGAAYLVAAGVALRALREAREEAKARRELHARHLHEKMERVAEPVREAMAERRASAQTRGRGA